MGIASSDLAPIEDKLFLTDDLLFLFSALPPIPTEFIDLPTALLFHAILFVFCVFLPTM